MDTDSALRMLGRYSKWQLRTYTFYAIGFGIPFAWMIMAIVFIGDTPNYRCALPPNGTVNESIPFICDSSGENCKYEQCHMYKNLSIDNSTVECQYGYWYDPASGYESTIVTEFDLVCGKNWLVELVMVLSSVGGMLGGFVYPALSDAFGRRKLFLLCLWSNILISCIQSFSVNMWMFGAIGFIYGIQQQGMVATGAVLAIELFPEEQRTFAGVGIEFFWAIGYMSLILMAFFIRNWRHLLLAISLPLTLTLSFYWFTYESIPWLVSNNKKEDAEKILKKAALFNGKPYPSHIFTKSYQQEELQQLKETGKNSKPHNERKTLNENQKELKMLTIEGKSNNGIKEPVTPRRYKIWDLLRSKKMTFYTLLQWFIWFTNSLGYGVISFTVTYLPGDRYLNSFLFAAMELPGYTIIWITMHYFGRRLPICVFHIIGGIALIGTIIQTYDLGVDLTPLIITLSVIGKLCFTATYAGIYVQTPELFPTNLRSTGLGICQVFARLGSFAVPGFRVLARTIPFLPPIIIGTASLLAGIAVLVLPESRYEPLPETMKDVELFERGIFKTKTQHEERNN